MSEGSVVVRCEFDSPKERNAAKDFLTQGKRPDFEDEVEETLRPLFLALEDVDYPDDLSKKGKVGLAISYDVLWVSTGSSAEEEAQSIIEKMAEGGASTVYAYFYDDGEYEVYWTLKDYQITKIYMPEENDELDEILFDLNDEKRLDKVIEFYEAGKI